MDSAIKVRNLTAEQWASDYAIFFSTGARWPSLWPLMWKCTDSAKFTSCPLCNYQSGLLFRIRLASRDWQPSQSVYILKEEPFSKRTTNSHLEEAVHKLILRPRLPLRFYAAFLANKLPTIMPNDSAIPPPCSRSLTESKADFALWILIPLLELGYTG